MVGLEEWATITLHLTKYGILAECEELEMENFIKKNDGNALMDFINEVEVLCDPETTFQITEEGKKILKELENENLKSD